MPGFYLYRILTITAITLASLFTSQAEALPSGRSNKISLPKLRESVIYKGELVDQNGAARESVVRIFTGEGTCTATLISDRSLLTAAHCVNNEEPVVVIQFFKRLKTKAFKKGSFMISRMTTQIYDFTPITFDLAVITFKTSLTEGSGAAFKPMTLANEKVAGAIEYGAPVFMFGAGQTQTGAISKDLMLAKGRLEGYDEDGTLTITGEGNQGICQGDSGGPVTIFAAGKHYLLGVASKLLTIDKTKCSREQYYRFLGPDEQDWIHREMQKAESALK